MSYSQQMSSKQLTAHAPVYCHADGNSGLDSSFFNSAEKGKVGIGYGKVLGFRRASVFFVRRPKVSVGGVYAGDYTDGIRNVALHLQLSVEVLGGGHGLDAGVRVIPTERFHAVFVEFCAAFKDLHIADFNGVWAQLLGLPARVLILGSSV